MKQLEEESKNMTAADYILLHKQAKERIVQTGYTKEIPLTKEQLAFIDFQCNFEIVVD